MKIKKTIVTVVAAVALSAAIAGPVAAGPPEVNGVITCDSHGNEDNPMSSERSWTKKAIAYYKRTESAMDACAKGSIGFKTIAQEV